MTEDDCIILSEDDDDVIVLDHFYNVDPIVIDLTREDRSQRFNQDDKDNSKSSNSSQDEIPQQQASEQQCSQESSQNNEDMTDEQTGLKPERADQNFYIPNQDQVSDDADDQNHVHQDNHQDQRVESGLNDGSNSSQPKPQSQDPKPPRHDIPTPLSQKNEDLTNNQSNSQDYHSPRVAHSDISKSDNSKSQKRTEEDDKKLMMDQKELGNLMFRREEFDKAKMTYQRANSLAKQLNDYDTSSKLHFNIAMTCENLGQFDQAINEFAQATRLNANYQKAHLKRAMIYDRLNKYDEALICWEHLIELYPDDYDIVRHHERAKERVRRQLMKKDNEILGLPSSFVSETELKKALREKRLAHHPDRHMDADEVTRKIEAKKFMDATEAYSKIRRRMGYG